MLGQQPGCIVFDATSGMRRGLRGALTVHHRQLRSVSIPKLHVHEEIVSMKFSNNEEYISETKGQGRSMKVTDIPVMSVTLAEVDFEIESFDY